MVHVTLRVHEHRRAAAVEVHHRLASREHRPNRIDRGQHRVRIIRLSWMRYRRIYDGIALMLVTRDSTRRLLYLEDTGPSTVIRSGENLYRVALAGFPPASALNTTTT